jgi:hypothetical protein
MNGDIVVGSLVVVDKVTKEALKLYIAHKNAAPFLMCCCAFRNKGVFVVDDVIDDYYAICHLDGGTTMILAPLRDLALAVEMPSAELGI